MTKVDIGWTNQEAAICIINLYFQNNLRIELQNTTLVDMLIFGCERVPSPPLQV